MSDAGRRDIELRIRAVDSTQADMRRLVQSIEAVSNALQDELKAAAAGKRTNDELRQSITQLEQAHKGLTGIGALVDQYHNLNTQIAESQEKVAQATAAHNAYQAELAQTEARTREQEAALRNLNRERERATRTLTQQQNMLTTISGDLHRAGIDTQNMAQAERELVGAAQQLGAALGPLREAHQNNSRVIREQREETARLREEEKRAADAAKERADAERRAGASIVAAQTEQRRRQEEFGQIQQRLETFRRTQTQNRQAEELAAQQRTASEQKKREDEFLATQQRLEQFRRKQASDRKAEEARQAKETDAETKRVEQNRLKAEASIQAAKKRAADEQARRDKDAAETEFRLRAFQRQRLADQERQAQGAVGAAGAGQQRLFGLRPYELQNLSFQINDVVTQLASGAHLTQVFAQQGGQIFQLWGRNIFDLLRFVPQLTVAIGALTVAFGALNHAMQDIQSTREFTSRLQLAAPGTFNFNAQQITQLRREVRAMGIDFEEAGTLIKNAMQAGFRNSTDLQQFMQFARDISDVTKQPLLEVGKFLSENLGQGYDGIVRINEVTKTFNAEQLTTIRRLFEQGKAAEALRTAYDGFANSAREAARNALTPFEQTLRNVSTLWSKLLDDLAKTSTIQGFVSGMQRLTEETKNWTAALIANEQERQKWMNAGSVLAGAAAGAAIGAGIGAPTGIGAFPGAVIGAGVGAIGTAVALSPTPGALPPAPAGSVGIGPGVVMTPDTETIKKIVAIAISQIPGATAEITSGRAARPGRPDSQHPQGMAVDVELRINGKPVPGFMGTDTTGLYRQLFANMLAAQQQFFPELTGRLASGTEFGDEDAGHFDLGGRRGTRPRQAPATVTFPVQGPPQPLQPPVNTTAQAALDAQVDAARRRLAIEQATTDEQEKAAKLAEYRATLADKLRSGTAEEKKAAEELVAIRAKEIDIDQRAKVVDFEHRINQARLEDGKNFQRIYAAGLDYMEKLKSANNGVLTVEKQRAAILQGMDEARKQAANEEAAKTAQRQINQELANRAIAVGTKGLLDLAAALDQVRQKQAAQRQAIDKQIEDARGKGQTITVDRDQIARTERAELIDKEAEIRLKNIQSLAQTRQETIAAVNASIEAGGMTIAEGQEAIKRAFEATTPEIEKQTAAFQAFLTANRDAFDPTRLDQFTAKLKQFRAESQYIDPLWKTIKTTFETSFSTNATNAFNTVAEALGGLIARTKTWKDVWVSLRVATANFFAGLLKDLANAILQAELKKLASSITGGISGGSGGGIFGFLFGAATGSAGSAAAAATPVAVTTLNPQVAALFHQGGVVGLSATPTGQLWAADWSRASLPRYKTGAIIGLSHDEQAAILHRGEEVLTRDDPRNVLNRARAGGGGRDVNIRSILVADPSYVPTAMASSQGEQIVIQHLVKNAATVRQLIKG